MESAVALRQNAASSEDIDMPSKKQVLARIESFIDPYRVVSGKGFRLKDMDPADTRGLGSESKPQAKELLARGVEWLAEQQDKLYAQDRWSVLLVFQAMDAAGKDGTIKHVMSGVNPQGCQVFSFKQPSSEELDHDYLWRYMKCIPERGRIGIFNRSYYEEVLVVRVHEQILQNQKLAGKLVSKRIWDERLEDIAAFERYLARNGVVLLKFFLNVSREEQKRRFMERLDLPQKNWKFSALDVKERGHWNDYMRAYQEAIRGTAAKHAPWFVVPADNKWFTRLVVAAAVVEAMEKLDLAYPRIDSAKRKELAAARALLGNE
jgi:PPK2 family polyphosphate:nucleotide phosphotransferase